jgi:23S rRNA pseudouridine2457 synthase
MPKKFSYYIVYKPFNVLCQFSKDDSNKETLSDYFTVEKNVYPVGRLDYDSEGLLLLTNDKSITQQLLHPSKKHTKEYWVQVEGEVSEGALKQLQIGVTISVNNKPYKTLPCQVEVMQTPILPERNPPIRFRKNIPTSWLKLIITEGKNRQVRKMTAAVGLPTLRLVRFAIEKINLGNMKAGEMILLHSKSIYKKLFSQ